MRERLLHALDLAMLGDWAGAKRTLEDLDDPIVPRLTALLTDQQRRERERAEVQAVARHELGNAISIAQANMEALVDGVLDPTPERLAAIRDAMITCGLLLDDLKRQTLPMRDHEMHIQVFDVCQLILEQIQLVSGIAESKNVRVHYGSCGQQRDTCSNYRGDPDRVALVVRDVLLGAVRYTPPGGSIDITCVRPDGEIEFSVSVGPATNGDALGFSVASKLLEAIGGRATILAEAPFSTTLLLRLPVIPLVS